MIAVMSVAKAVACNLTTTGIILCASNAPQQVVSCALFNKTVVCINKRDRDYDCIYNASVENMNADIKIIEWVADLNDRCTIPEGSDEQ